MNFVQVALFKAKEIMTTYCMLKCKTNYRKIKKPHSIHHYCKKRGLSNILHIPAFLVPWLLADGQALFPVEWIPDAVAASDLQNLEDLPIQL
jgi:hypothetical protein